VKLNNKQNRRKNSGQAVVEYILLITLTAAVSLTFMKFMLGGFFGDSFKSLPDTTARSISRP